MPKRDLLCWPGICRHWEKQVSYADMGSEIGKRHKSENQKECVSWQRQAEDISTPEGSGVSTEAVQFQGKCQQIQYDFCIAVN